MVRWVAQVGPEVLGQLQVSHWTVRMTPLPAKSLPQLPSQLQPHWSRRGVRVMDKRQRAGLSGQQGSEQGASLG